MRSGAVLPALWCCAAALADENLAGTQAPSPSTHFKLTPSYYQSSDGNDAWDWNVRANRGPHAGWLGLYRDRQDLRQWRSGYEYTEDLGAGQIVWSAQAADGGFLGGSINAQVGTAVYAMLGFGRTNLRPYYNLNFDPNDALTLGLGGQLVDDTAVAFYHIWDDRLGTHQHVTHLYLHHAISETERFSVDASLKRGLDANNDFVRGVSLAITYARQDYFLRIAHDQYANFGSATQNRISLGFSF